MTLSALQLRVGLPAARSYSSALGRPCAAPACWLIRAITPAISGVATEVPPTSSAPPEVVEPVLSRCWCRMTAFETQISVALSRAPSPAKKLTSGRSRTPSLGMPVMPDCQVGFGQPSFKRVGSP